VTEPYYSDDLVTLYLGDCREVTDWLDADVLVTDPPYGMAHLSGWDSPQRRIAGDSDGSVRDAALDLWGGKPAAVFGTWKKPRPLRVRHLVVWDKSEGTGCGMGDLSAAWGNSHEEIYFLGEWKRGDRPRHPSVIRTKDGLRSLSRSTGHPTPKPVGLITTILSHAPLGTVADPFAGSGSTLVAAKQLGRRAIGIELEERYCEIVARRLAQGALELAPASNG
jgi:site-specific DNA-methyltransferase (adenine-specific)